MLKRNIKLENCSDVFWKGLIWESSTVWSGQQINLGKSLPNTVGTHTWKKRLKFDCQKYFGQTNVTCHQLDGHMKTGAFREPSYHQNPFTMTYHKEFLGQKSVKILNSNNVQVDRKSVDIVFKFKSAEEGIFSILGLRPGSNLSRSESWVARVLRARTKTSHHCRDEY